MSEREQARGFLPKSWEIAYGTVHVWIGTLNLPAHYVQQLAEVLSEDERQRAQCYRSKSDRQSFIVARGQLRVLLGAYLGIIPSQVQFRYGASGKPILMDTDVDSTLHFNLSHSHKLVLYGFTHYRRIGVDVEYIRSLQDLEQLAAQYFSIGERAALGLCPMSERNITFFTYWARKEALVKATGEGLASLRQFDVPVIPEYVIQSKSTRWQVQDLKVLSGYAAALAVEGEAGRLICRRLTAQCILLILARMRQTLP